MSEQKSSRMTASLIYGVTGGLLFGSSYYLLETMTYNYQRGNPVFSRKGFRFQWPYIVFTPLSFTLGCLIAEKNRNKNQTPLLRLE